MKLKKLLSLLLSLLLVFSLCVPAFAAKAVQTVKNVIMMIGDGMGENHLALAEEQGAKLFCTNNCDLRGQSKTRSFSSKVTDSAAGGTALACGVRVVNSAVAVYPIDPLGALFRPRSITENAIAHGMRTGVITTDSTTGATPATFSAHTSDRSNGDDITAGQLASGIDLIWGADAGVTAEAARENGFTFITNETGMKALKPGSRSFAQFSGQFWRRQTPKGCTAPTLAEMTVKAISLLNEGNENGFFLMVEGAHIDKNSHRTEDGVTDFPAKIADTVDAVRGFDDAIRAAAEFARRDGNTLILITADHETGDLYEENGRLTFHSGSHTGKNVPVLVFGADDLFNPGEALKNKELPVLLAERLGWARSEFPQADPGSFIQKLVSFFRQPLLKKAAA